MNTFKESRTQLSFWELFSFYYTALVTESLKWDILMQVSGTATTNLLFSVSLITARKKQQTVIIYIQQTVIIYIDNIQDIEWQCCRFHMNYLEVMKNCTLFFPWIWIYSWRTQHLKLCSVKYTADVETYLAAEKSVSKKKWICKIARKEERNYFPIEDFV